MIVNKNLEEKENISILHSCNENFDFKLFEKLQTSCEKIDFDFSKLRINIEYGYKDSLLENVRMLNKKITLLENEKIDEIFNQLIEQLNNENLLDKRFVLQHYGDEADKIKSKFLVSFPQLETQDLAAYNRLKQFVIPLRNASSLNIVNEINDLNSKINSSNSSMLSSDSEIVQTINQLAAILVKVKKDSQLKDLNRANLIDLHHTHHSELENHDQRMKKIGITSQLF